MRSAEPDVGDSAAGRDGAGPQHAGAASPGAQHAGRASAGGEGVGAEAAGEERAAYLRQVCGLLWPAPATATIGTAGRPPASARSRFVVIPSLRRPRLLVPAEPMAASAAVRHYGEPGSITARLGSRALSLLFASGSGGALLRGRLHVRAPAGADTIESYLAGVLGRDVRMSMHLTSARANRKPVLQLLTPRGEPVAFAKIGVSALTRDLVQAEHDALSRLAAAPLGSVAAPRVLHHGRWRDLDVLVLSPLPVWSRRRPLPAAKLAAAMAEIARVHGLSDQPVEGVYLPRLREQLTAAGPTADRETLLGALAAIPTQAAATTLTFGAWHGDWTPWNMANTRHGLLVWDWERFATGVPVGFDTLHYWLQSQVVGGRLEPGRAADRCIEIAPRLLATLDIGAAAARITAILYLSALATRYLVDRQASAGARLGAPGNWLIPAIVSEVTRL